MLLARLDERLDKESALGRCVEPGIDCLRNDCVAARVMGPAEMGGNGREKLGLRVEEGVGGGEFCEEDMADEVYVQSR